jgi:hypothetical protein
MFGRQAGKRRVEADFSDFQIKGIFNMSKDNRDNPFRLLAGGDITPHYASLKKSAPPKDNAANNPDAAGDGVSSEVVVNGVRIRLDDVSPHLRMRYHAVARREARHAGTKAELQSIREQMLAEVFPQKALKSSMVSTRLTGRDAVAKLLGCKPSK